MFERVITQPAVEPVTVEEQCLFSRIPVPSDDEDNVDRLFIESCIAAAREQIEYLTKQAMITQRWLLTFDYFPGQDRRFRTNYSDPLYTIFHHFRHDDSIELLRRPVSEQGGDGIAPVVQYIDCSNTLQTFDSSNYTVYADKIQLKVGKCWPLAASLRDAVRIMYTVGYGADATTTPERMKTATKYLAGHFYDVRNPVSTEMTQPVINTLNALLSGFMSFRIPS